MAVGGVSRATRGAAVLKDVELELVWIYLENNEAFLCHA
jgi:hypothetical protein